MLLDWDKIKKLSWNDIDTFIYRGDNAFARRLIGNQYMEVYGSILRSSVQHDVVSERANFLWNHYSEKFLVPLYSSEMDESGYIYSSIDMKRYKIIRFCAEWNAATDDFDVLEYNYLLGMAEYNEINVSNSNEYISNLELFQIPQSPMTKFDPEYVLPSYSDLVDRAEAILKPLAQLFNVEYYIQQEPI